MTDYLGDARRRATEMQSERLAAEQRNQAAASERELKWREDLDPALEYIENELAQVANQFAGDAEAEFSAKLERTVVSQDRAVVALNIEETPYQMGAVKAGRLSVTINRGYHVIVFYSLRCSGQPITVDKHLSNFNPEAPAQFNDAVTDFLLAAIQPMA